MIDAACAFLMAPFTQCIGAIAILTIIVAHHIEKE